ncbi:MAG: hypothetical protein JF586_22045 [Burkholderiales bacterium]|nr:hypothetical protein [Burkholderiales bacterium]
MLPAAAPDPPLPAQASIMTLDTHVRIAAVLHIVMGALSLCLLFVIGAMAAAVGVYGGSFGIAGDVGAMIGGIGMIVVITFALFAVLEIVGAVMLMRGNDSGRVITLVFSVLHLINVPIGTAVGGYSLWALLRNAPQPMAPGAPVRSGPTGPA